MYRSGWRISSLLPEFLKDTVVPSKLCVLFGLFAAGAVQAETGRHAWLRYAEIEGPALRQYRETIPAVVSTLNQSPIVANARQEMIRGIRGMLGRTLRGESGIPTESAIVLGAEADVRSAFPEWRTDGALAPDGYSLKTIQRGDLRYTIVSAQNDRGVLYGAFHLLQKIALGELVGSLNEQDSPYAPVRWVNEWDNLNGSIERGYGGRRFFGWTATRGWI